MFHTKSVRRFRMGYCPCQPSCNEWIPKEGEYLPFKDHHCKERLWSASASHTEDWCGRGYICVGCFPTYCNYEEGITQGFSLL